MSIFYRSGPVTHAPGSYAWPELMSIALAIAKKGARLGEIPVGAVIVDNGGTILASEHNRVETDNNPVAHAEILALTKAAQKIKNCRLNGCVLVVTLEPCVMCAAACVEARIDGLVYGAYSPRKGAITSNMDYFDLPDKTPRIWHMGGIMEKECGSILQKFLGAMRR